MNLENFLEFWTQNNRIIIELTFGFVFLMILFLIYRQFFSHHPEGDGSHSATGVNINTSEIQEKLQKIMENQLSFKGQIGGFEGYKPTAGSEAPAASSASATGQSGASVDLAPFTKEIDDLKQLLKAKDSKIEELSKIGNSLAAQVGNGTVAAAADTTALDAKIKELEGRLQEYEIISEDIADLSFYKEENSRLQKELGDLKGGAAPTPSKSTVPVAPTPPPAATPAPVAPAAQAATVVEQAKSTPVAEDPAAAASGPIDDDIMKEFAAAIEDQKKPTTEAPKEIDSGKLKESQQLMGDFENFLKKG